MNNVPDRRLYLLSISRHESSIVFSSQLQKVVDHFGVTFNLGKAIVAESSASSVFRVRLSGNDFLITGSTLINIVETILDNRPLFCALMLFRYLLFACIVGGYCVKFKHLKGSMRIDIKSYLSLKL